MTRTILDWLHVTRLIPWIFTATIVAVMLGSAVYDDVRFYLRPIVVMQGEVIERTSEYFRIHMFGEKVRGVECKFLGIQAFGDRSIGLPVDLTIQRVDMPSDGLTKPNGEYDIGIWELRPVLGVITARVYTTHDCEGTLRPTLIAEVRL